jgi:hypothetical protein
MTHSEIGKANGNDALFRFRLMSARSSLNQGPPTTAGSCGLAPSVIAGSSFVASLTRLHKLVL